MRVGRQARTARTGGVSAASPAVSPSVSVSVSGGSSKRPHTRRTGDADLEAIKPLAVTVEQAAKMLMVSRATMYAMVMRGEIESFLVGPRLRRISLATLERVVSGSGSGPVRLVG